MSEDQEPRTQELPALVVQRPRRHRGLWWALAAVIAASLVSGTAGYTWAKRTSPAPSSHTTVGAPGQPANAEADKAAAEPSTAPSATPSSPANQAAVQLGFSDRLTDLAPADLANRLQEMKQDGATLVRVDVEWRYIEKSPGDYDFSDFSPMVRAIHAAGLEPVIVAGYAPDSASDDTGCADKICAPANTAEAVAAYGNFFTALVRQYSTAAYGVRTFEAWNEANINQYWPDPDAAVYSKFLRAAAGAVRQVSRQTGRPLTILPTGLAYDPNDGILPASFLADMYAAGAGHYFDAGNVHPYLTGQAPTNQPGTDTGWAQMLSVRQVMIDHGDQAKPIWVTEFSYSTGHTSEDVTLQQQADYLDQALKLYATYKWRGPFIWHVFQDGSSEDWGLIDKHGADKPARQVFRSYGHG